MSKNKHCIIWVDKQTDVLRSMVCQKCGNPISMFCDYKCPKCKTQHYFKLNKIIMRTTHTISGNKARI